MSSQPDAVVGAQMRQVIEIVYRRGVGVTTDPVRIVYAYFDPDGTKLAERDPALGTPNGEVSPLARYMVGDHGVANGGNKP